MKTAKALKTIGKNPLAFLTGAVIGVAVVIIFILPWALKATLTGKDPGAVLAGAIVLPVVFLIIYGALGVLIGGFGAIIIYNIVRHIKKKGKIYG
ncbi:MAG: hypothetical protein AAB577_01730 [Patescibacteria group bacterium]